MERKPSKLSESQSEKLIKVEGPRDSIEDPKRKSAGSIHKPPQKLPEPEVQLVEDVFGLYYDENRESHNIKRFTWRNKNKIQVQVINYGARITSIKLPDRRGEIEDIVLGFDDLAGYIYYQKHYFGATIGRMSNIVRNSTFVVDQKQYWLTPNKPPHHFNGGQRGLDQAVWNTYIEGKKVIMSHISPHLTEGYPGDLLVRVTFELSARNEFNISMDAQCTQPTIVNLSNLTYFNLAGHYAGPDHTYRHVLTINSNCFTAQEKGMPTGEILNVVHTQCDFQIPKTLGKVLGVVPRDGFNHNLCVNRGMDQGDCFVARMLHPPSGRMLEIYSNQCGVNFSTADEFGYGRVLTMEQIMPEDAEEIEPPDVMLTLFERVHKELMLHLAVDERSNYYQIRDLIVKIRDKALAVEAANLSEVPSKLTLEKCDGIPDPNMSTFIEAHPTVSKSQIFTDQSAVGSEEMTEEEEYSCVSDFVLTPLQMDYLQNTFNIVSQAVEDEEWIQLRNVMRKILDTAIIEEYPVEEGMEEEGSLMDESLKIPNKISAEVKPKKKKKPLRQNQIPFFYKSSDKIIGKERAVYRMHGGISLQTQNYPACANYKNFPSCVLRPGEVYKHTITYRFWIRAGNPNKWIKRNLAESKKQC
ncbi:hypothetical protein NQ317_015750 [Molorchus minor]|uniref:Galactose mutarotase n=1 Tax=Molorchus minor TaxID=1323400 RepID=A0ABQ9K3C3_9CUCU|nr:hypothetical protein NQ317_015750 [Molorchus minor]